MNPDSLISFADSLVIVRTTSQGESMISFPLLPFLGFLLTLISAVASVAWLLAKRTRPNQKNNHEHTPPPNSSVIRFNLPEVDNLTQFQEQSLDNVLVQIRKAFGRSKPIKPCIKDMMSLVYLIRLFSVNSELRFEAAAYLSQHPNLPYKPFLQVALLREDQPHIQIRLQDAIRKINDNGGSRQS